MLLPLTVLIFLCFIGPATLKDCLVVNSQKYPTECSILNQTNLPKLTASIFEAFPKMESLNADSIELETFDENCFQNASNLREFRGNFNQIKSLEDKLFAGAFNLICLELHHNEISHLDENVFLGLQNLTKLNLASNKIRILPSNIFLPLAKLKFADLSRNQIELIPRNLLVNCGELMEFNLQGNHIKRMELEILIGLPISLNLNLLGNRCVDRNFTVSWLKVADLVECGPQDNKIEDLESKVDRNFYLFLGFFSFVVIVLVVKLIFRKRKIARPTHELLEVGVQTEDEACPEEITKTSDMTIDLVVEQNKETVNKISKSMENLLDLRTSNPDLELLNRRRSNSLPTAQTYNEENTNNDKTISKISFSIKSQSISRLDRPYLHNNKPSLPNSTRNNGESNLKSELEEDSEQIDGTHPGDGSNGNEIKEITSRDENEEKINNICETLLNFTEEIMKNVKN